MGNRFIWAATGLLGLCAANGTAAMAADSPAFIWTSVEPVVDVTKKLECGIKLRTKEERIAFNLRWAQYYYQGFVEGAKRNVALTPDYYGCTANEMTASGSGNPHVIDPDQNKPPRNVHRSKELEGTGAPNFWTLEMRAYWCELSDFQAVPGTFRAYPSEDGVFWFQWFRGHTKEGKEIAFWETDYGRINDEGKMTHFEYWDEQRGIDELVRATFGISHEEMRDSKNPGKYLELLRAKSMNKCAK